MYLIYLVFILLYFPFLASASQSISCSLEHNGDTSVLHVPEGANALDGSWKDMGRFKVRALLATPFSRRHWLQVEVYALAGDGDYRILSSQKVFAPFVTGRLEVVEPSLGRSLKYKCEQAK